MWLIDSTGYRTQSIFINIYQYTPTAAVYMHACLIVSSMAVKNAKISS